MKLINSETINLYWEIGEEIYRKQYEAIQPEMDVIRAIVEARTSQNITRKELSGRTGINQADISK